MPTSTIAIPLLLAVVALVAPWPVLMIVLAVIWLPLGIAIGAWLLMWWPGKGAFQS